MNHSCDFCVNGRTDHHCEYCGKHLGKLEGEELSYKCWGEWMDNIWMCQYPLK